MVDTLLDIGGVAGTLQADLEVITRRLNEMGLEGIKLTRVQVSLDKASKNVSASFKGLTESGIEVSGSIANVDGQIEILNRTITENVSKVHSESAAYAQLQKNIRAVNAIIKENNRLELEGINTRIQQTRAFEDIDNRRRQTIEKSERRRVTDFPKAVKQIEQPRFELEDDFAKAEAERNEQRKKISKQLIQQRLDEETEINNITARERKALKESFDQRIRFEDSLIKKKENLRKIARSEIADTQKRIDLGRKEINGLNEAAKIRQFFGATGGFTTGGRTTVQQAFSAERALTNLTNFVQKNNIAAEQVQRIWNDVSRGVFTNYGGTLNKVRDRTLAFAQATSKLGDTSKNAAVRSAQEFFKLNEQIERGRKASNELLLSWRSIFRVGLVQIGHRALSSFISTLHEANEQARELSIRIGEIQTIDNKGVPFNKWSEELVKLSNSFGVDVVDQAAGAYEILSNQLFEGVEATQLLETANRLAVTGVSTTKEAVDLLSSAIIAFGKSTDDSELIATQFFKTVDLGRTRINELSQIYGRLAVPANQAGISMDELNAAIATTTRQGVRTSEAFTFLRNVILKLIKPTDAMKDFFKELGVNSGEAAIATFGLGGFLAKLEERTKGSSTELAELFSTVRAVTGAMVFAGDGLEQFNSDLKAMQDTTVDLDEKLKLVQDTIGKRFDIELTKFKNSLLRVGTAFTELGIVSLKGINLITNGLGEAEKAANKFVENSNKQLDTLLSKRQEIIKKQNESVAESQRKQLQALADQNAAINKQVGSVDELQQSYDKLLKVEEQLRKSREDEVRKFDKGQFETLLANVDLLPRFRSDKSRTTEAKQLLLIEEQARRVRQQSLRIDLFTFDPKKPEQRANREAEFLRLREDLTDLNKQYIDLQNKEFENSIKIGKVKDTERNRQNFRLKQIQQTNRLEQETVRIIDQAFRKTKQSNIGINNVIKQAEARDKERLVLIKQNDEFDERIKKLKQINTLTSETIVKLGQEADIQRKISQTTGFGDTGQSEALRTFNIVENVSNVLRRLATEPLTVTTEQIVKASQQVATLPEGALQTEGLSTNLSELIKVLRKDNPGQILRELQDSINKILPSTRKDIFGTSPAERQVRPVNTFFSRQPVISPNRFFTSEDSRQKTPTDIFQKQPTSTLEVLTEAISELVNANRDSGDKLIGEFNDLSASYLTTNKLLSDLPIKKDFNLSITLLDGILKAVSIFSDRTLTTEDLDNSLIKFDQTISKTILEKITNPIDALEATLTSINNFMKEPITLSNTPNNSTQQISKGQNVTIENVTVTSNPTTTKQLVRDIERQSRQGRTSILTTSKALP